eukprot:1408158-Pleurochrysis_carterae.AAC.1
MSQICIAADSSFRSKARKSALRMTAHAGRVAQSIKREQQAVPQASVSMLQVARWLSTWLHHPKHRVSCFSWIGNVALELL